MDELNTAQKTNDELLENIHTLSQQYAHIPSLSFAPFATLLVQLSKEASETADKNLKMQRNTIYITLIILAISVAQLLVSLLKS